MMRRGSNHPRAKLTEDDIRVIRRLAASGTTKAELARKYGVLWATISKIVKRENWGHVK